MNVRKFAAFKHVEEGNFWRRGGCSLLLMAICLVMVSCSSSSSSNNSNPPPTATLTATPNSVFLGASTTVTLVFTSTNADSGTISGQGPVGINSKITIPEPNATTIYTYTATGTGGTATASATVTVNPAPVVGVTLTASPMDAIAGPDGVSLTLTWTSSNATSVTISGVPNGPVGVPTSGNYSFPASVTNTYTATAYGADGQEPVTSVVKVLVNAVTSFNGLDSTVPGGLTEDDIDPNGAVGTKQFVEYVNTSYQAYDKTPPYAPVYSTPQSIGTPWKNVPQCADPKIQLDAVVSFDRLASRWVIAAKATVQPDFDFCIAVSNTDDFRSTNPPFAWNAYWFDLHPYLQIPGGNGTYYYPDWPKLGTWWNGYYVGMDMVNHQTQVESGAVACAFDRTSMLAGAPQSASLMQCEPFETTNANGGVYLAHSLIPADVDGTTPPANGRDEYMLSIQNPPIDSSDATTSSSVNLWDCQLSWSPASFSCAQSSITVPSYQPGCYTWERPAQTDCVQEPGVTGLGGISIDSVGDRLMPRFAYRNFGSYESFLISHTVQPDPALSETGIRWYELQANGTGAPTLAQSGTIFYGDNNFRFLPSIAQDKIGNVVAGYSISTAENPPPGPGINASFWNLNGPNGPATTPNEVTILNGPGEEIPIPTILNPNTGQWGSYATITVDPTDDCTFWYANEYWPANTTGLPGPWSTNISYFKVPGCQ